MRAHPPASLVARGDRASATSHELTRVQLAATGGSRGPGRSPVMVSSAPRAGNLALRTDAGRAPPPQWASRRNPAFKPHSPPQQLTHPERDPPGDTPSRSRDVIYRKTSATATTNSPVSIAAEVNGPVKATSTRQRHRREPELRDHPGGPRTTVRCRENCGATHASTESGTCSIVRAPTLRAIRNRTAPHQRDHKPRHRAQLPSLTPEHDGHVLESTQIGSTSSATHFSRACFTVRQGSGAFGSHTLRRR